MLIGLLSFYDEPKGNLTRSLSALAELGVRRVAAVDGAYAALQGGRPTSVRWQTAHLRAEADRLGLQLELHEPEQTWSGNEIEKRTFLFTYAAEKFKPTLDDWYVVMDADSSVEGAHDLGPWLAGLDGDAVEVLVIEHAADFPLGQRRRFVRSIFRCLPDLHVGPENHWTYRDGEGRVLWGVDAVPRAGIAPFVLHNRSDDRSRRRVSRRAAYYRRRDEEGLETLDVPCCRCGTDEGVALISTDFDVVRSPDGRTDLIQARRVALCRRHSNPVRYRNAMRLSQLGLSPGRLRLMQTSIPARDFTPGPIDGADPLWP